MGEIDAIETAIGALVDSTLADLDQLTVISALITAYTDVDVNALDEAGAKADLINAIDCIEKLIDELSIHATNYTTITAVQARLGWTITATSRPNTTAVTILLGEADKKINGEMKVTTNITDTYGALSPVAAALVVKMVNNILAIAEPDNYALVDEELTESDLRTIHYTYSVWSSKHWKMG